jgi:hypothetical protein
MVDGYTNDCPYRQHLDARSFFFDARMMPACGSESPDASGQPQNLELYSWWTAPGEADALKALLDLYRQEHPKTSVINAALTDFANAQTQLATRMTSGMPPDTFQVLGGGQCMQWVAYNGRDDSDSKMEPLDDLALAQSWKGGFFQSKGLHPDVEYGQASVPGTQGVFTFATDTFGLPKGAANRKRLSTF